ncbi:MAG: hypothetical protein DRP42_01910 [Tenericutes bacterium]|nr:MAG: hypothetical protein DRP42_01910 [Mycoplasmatota bacterium]
MITTEKGKEYTGVVGSTPPHIMEYAQTKAVVKIKDMYIDLGASNAKEIEKLGIKPGDIISPDSKMFTMPNGDFVVGKAMDNRAAVAVGIEVMKKLSKVNLDCNVTFVGTTQEEVGLRGARTSAYK